MTPSRQESEERVVAAVREWLPQLPKGAVIHIEALDPALETDGTHFAVSGLPRTFTCTRGGDRGTR